VCMATWSGYDGSVVYCKYVNDASYSGHAYNALATQAVGVDVFSRVVKNVLPQIGKWRITSRVVIRNLLGGMVNSSNAHNILEKYDELMKAVTYHQFKRIKSKDSSFRDFIKEVAYQILLDKARIWTVSDGGGVNTPANYAGDAKDDVRTPKRPKRNRYKMYKSDRKLIDLRLSSNRKHHPVKCTTWKNCALCFGRASVKQKHPKRSNYECSTCKVRLCTSTSSKSNSESCWEIWHTAEVLPT